MRIAPKGFSEAEWETFNRDGIIVIEDALDAEKVAALLDAVDRVAAADPRYVPGNYLSIQNFVERDPVLASLIDDAHHIGYMYDLYGELLKLQLSELFLRTPGGGRNNKWHPDGARALPYQVFSPTLPLQTKVGYWLTDLSEQQRGNFVYIPGSHRRQTFEGYDTHDEFPEQRVLQVKPGAMTIMHGSIWHMVQPNTSTVTRKNLFLAYSPSWITAVDRYMSNPDWLASLNREQQIIMRSYKHPYDNAKPPAEHFPLFLDRETGLDHDPGVYADNVALHRRKRTTWHEKHNQPVPA